METELSSQNINQKLIKKDKSDINREVLDLVYELNQDQQ